MVERQGDDADKLVILYHVSPVAIHWDILIHPAHAPQLLAWRCLIDPAGWFLTSRPFSATVIRLPDHRLKYLNYFGPISDNRGWVTPVLRRIGKIIHRSDTEMEMMVETEIMPWRLWLRQIEGKKWMLEAHRRN
ncbi:MAG: hypothetical protein ACP5O1_02825 [Phycisphaerae bacterium]